MCHDALHLELLFSINEVRWGTGEVRAVRSRLMIRVQKGQVEHVVHSPIDWEIKLIRHW